MLLQEEYFQAKGASRIQKQDEVNTKLGKELCPPLVEILKATSIVKGNLTSLEAELTQLESDTEINVEERKELTKEINKVKALLRNLNLLILDIFKEFDQVIEKIQAQQKAQAAKEGTAS